MKKMKRNTVLMAGLATGAIAWLLIMAIEGEILPQNCFKNSKNTANHKTAPKDEVSPSDAQIDTMLMRLHDHDNTTDKETENMLRSLKNYDNVLKTRQNQQKTK